MAPELDRKAMLLQRFSGTIARAAATLAELNTTAQYEASRHAPAPPPASMSLTGCSRPTCTPPPPSYLTPKKRPATDAGTDADTTGSPKLLSPPPPPKRLTTVHSCILEKMDDDNSGLFDFAPWCSAGSKLAQAQGAEASSWPKSKAARPRQCPPPAIINPKITHPATGLKVLADAAKEEQAGAALDKPHSKHQQHSHHERRLAPSGRVVGRQLDQVAGPYEKEALQADQCQASSSACMVKQQQEFHEHEDVMHAAKEDVMQERARKARQQERQKAQAALEAVEVAAAAKVEDAWQTMHDFYQLLGCTTVPCF